MKKSNVLIILIVSLIFLVACWFTVQHKRWRNPPYSPEINKVLFMAGKNRPELEKVLKHYSYPPADSLKLKAAEFLIINMPGKYSEYYDVPWNDVATVYLRWTSVADRQRVLNTYKFGEKVRQNDVEHISANFLIDNIDLAFEAWRNRPWGKHVSFDAFCEEILPYRVGTEQLEDWRRKALASFSDIDARLNDPATTAVDACCMINELLPKFRMDKDFPSMNFSQALASTRGPCKEMATLATFALRAHGVPVTLETTPLWVGLPNGHAWNTVRDSLGNHITFMGTDTNPYKPHQGVTYPKAKAYRHTFASHKKILTANEHIPPLLKEHANMKDVTAEHNYMDTVTVHLKYHAGTPTGYVYLAIDNNGDWRPVAWTKVEGDSARFLSIGKGIIYCPVYYANGKYSVAGNPFWLDGNGKMNICQSDSPHSLITFYEIAPEDRWNKIYAGREYELFYWNKKGWQSLGKKRATVESLSWNAPPQALFRLDYATGKEKGMLFVMDENTQMFWREPPRYNQGLSIVQCKRVDVSDVRNDVPAEQGKNAVDGKIDGNRWVAEGEGSHWIELEFDKPTLINSFRFITGNSQGKPQSEYETKKFEFQAWNGSDWTTIVSETQNKLHNYVGNFTPVRTGSVRLVTYGNTRLIEIEVYEKFE